MANRNFRETIDESDENILYTEDEECYPDSGGLGKVLFSHMKKNGDSIAQIDGLTGEEDTYSAYLQRAIRAAIKIRKKGVTRDDIILICSYNHLHTTDPFLASLFLGIKVAKMDPTLSVDEISKLLTNLRPKLIFVSTDCTTLIEDSLEASGVSSEVIIFGETSKHTPYSDFLEESDEEASFQPVEITDLQETVMILYSSGSTGLPKGVCLHHYGFLCTALEYSRSPFSGTTMLLFSSIYWVSQLICITASIVSNGKRIIVPGYDKNIIWNLIQKYNVFMTFMSPSQAITWCKGGRPKEIEKCKLKVLAIGGAKISEEQMRNISNLLPEALVAQGWAMTELTGRGTFVKFKDLSKLNKNKLYTSVGTMSSGLTFKVVDCETGKSLGPNQPGELKVKTRFMMNGYFGIDSSSTFDEDGWLKTGDLVYYDEERYFYIIERIKEILQFRTHHIHPSNIESVIQTHPSVQSVVVVGIPDLEDVQHPAAAVVLKDSAKDCTTEEDIEKFVEKNMNDKHRLRGGVMIIDKLPLASSGKIRRRIIQESIEEHRRQKQCNSNKAL